MPDHQNGEQHHYDKLPKPLQLPDKPGEIIGYTGDIDTLPTVYFETGHYTQYHQKSYNVGWESCEAWQCLFFGNVPIDKHLSPLDPKFDPKNSVLNVYFGNLEKAGTNRYNGRSFEQQSLIDGHEGRDILIELWILGEGKSEAEQFRHPARHHFTPVPNNRKDNAVSQLWKQLSPMVLSGKSLKRVEAQVGVKIRWTVVEVQSQSLLQPGVQPRLAQGPRSKSPVQPRFAPSSSGARPSATGKTT